MPHTTTPTEATRVLDGDSHAATERTPLLNPARRQVDPGLPESSGIQNDDACVRDDIRVPIAPSLTEAGDAGRQHLGFVRATICCIALGLLVFLQATNFSLLTTLQSAIVVDLDISDNAPWLTSAYLIAFSALGPLNGKFSAAFSPRPVICTASALLAAGAALCANATSFPAFIAGRVASGMGASGVITVSVIIILDKAPVRYRAIAMAFLNSGFTLGVAVGAALAGVLEQHIGWRMLFWLQTPIAIASGVGLAFVLHSTDPKLRESVWKRLGGIDYLGAITLTVTIVFLLYGLSSPSSIPALPLVFSALAFTAFIINEAYIAEDPIIPILLLRSRALLCTCVATMGFMMGRWVVLFYAPIYAIAVRRWSLGLAGSILLPTNMGFAFGGLLVGGLHIRHHGSFYVATLATYMLCAASLFAMAFLLTRNSSAVLFVAALFVNGAATGASLNYNIAHLLYLTPTETHYVATALLATFRSFAGSFGSTIGGGLFTRTLSELLNARFADHGLRRSHLVRRLLGSPALVASLEGVESEVAISSYEDSLKILWLSAAALAASTVFVQAVAGWRGSDHSSEASSGLSTRNSTLAEQSGSLSQDNDDEEQSER